MRISVLGPLEVTDDNGTPIPLQATKQRALLGVLVCYRNAPVSIDRILDVLWPDTGPPASARSNVHLYVHRLRARIGDASIVRTTNGYQLAVRPGEADDEQFEELLAQARRAAEAGDPATASETFGRALRLWRDAAYADLHHVSPLHVEATRLDELRLNAIEGRIDADLELGRHRHLTSELTRLVTEHPMRERLRWQLMLALYRSGRASDALEAYRAGHTLLVAELGMDPGPELRKLHEAILNEDPALAPPARAAPSSAGEASQDLVRVPAELPRADSAFTGRHDLLANLRGVIADGHAVVAINGPGGVGKSALARKLAHSVISSFRDGQLYVNLYGSTPGVTPTEPPTALGRLLRSLGYEDRQIPAEADEAAALFRTATASKRLLILLDNAASASQVRPLLPSGAGSAVIITSRSVLSTLDGADHVRLNVLPPDEAVALLTQLAGDERTRAAPDAAADVAHHCGYLPLAIRIAGARLVAEPSWDLRAAAEWLANASSRLDELEQDDLAFRATSDVSYQRLAPPTARLFDLLGLLDLADISAPAAGALADLPTSQVAQQLDDLVDAQLVEAAAGRYTMHDLVRLYARERAQAHLGDAERNDAIRRVVRHYVATARQASDLIAPGATARRGAIGVAPADTLGASAPLPDGSAVAGWARAEIANFGIVGQHATRLGGDGAGVMTALAAALFHPLHTQGFWVELRALNQMALRQATIAGKPAWQAIAHSDLSAAHSYLRDPAGARWHGERALEISRELGDLAGEAAALDSLGNLACEQDQLEEGIQLFRAAIDVSRSLGDPWSEATALNNLGDAYRLIGRYDDAIATLTDALQIYESGAGSDADRGAIRLTIGETYGDAGRPRDAVSHLEQAVELFESAGHTSGVSLAAWTLGDKLHELNRVDAARAQWRRSVELLREMNVVTADEAEAILSVPRPRQPESLREARL